MSDATEVTGPDYQPSARKRLSRCIDFLLNNIPEKTAQSLDDLADKALALLHELGKRNQSAAFVSKPSKKGIRQGSKPVL